MAIEDSIRKIGGYFLGIEDEKEEEEITYKVKDKVIVTEDRETKKKISAVIYKEVKEINTKKEFKTKSNAVKSSEYTIICDGLALCKKMKSKEAPIGYSINEIVKKAVAGDKACREIAQKLLFCTVVSKNKDNKVEGVIATRISLSDFLKTDYKSIPNFYPKCEIAGLHEEIDQGEVAKLIKEL
jgi:hypothetical protein